MDDARLREVAEELLDAANAAEAGSGVDRSFVHAAEPILRSLLREAVKECEEAANGIAFPLEAIRERFAWLGEEK